MLKSTFSSILLAAILTVVWMNSVKAQPEHLWTRTYGGEGIEQGYSIVQISDSGFVIGGTINQNEGRIYNFLLLRISPTGDSLWSRNYGGEENLSCKQLIQTTDGGFTMAGRSTDSSHSVDCVVLRTDEDGNLIWRRSFGGEGDQQANSIVQTNDGGFAIAGFTGNYVEGNNDFWYMKVNEDGDSLWGYTIGGNNRDRANCIIQTSDNGLAIAGLTDSFGGGDWDMWLVKTDSTGEVSWSQTYGSDGSEACYSIVQLHDSGYALSGNYNSQPVADNPSQLLLVRTDENGDMLWSQSYGGRENEGCHSLIKTELRGFALAGYTGSNGAGRLDYWLLRVDDNGDSLWSSDFGTENDETAFSVKQTNDHGFALVGYTFIRNTSGYNIRIDLTGPDSIPPLSIRLIEPFAGDTLEDFEAIFSWEIFPDTMRNDVITYNLWLKTGNDSLVIASDNTEIVADFFEFDGRVTGWLPIQWWVEAINDSDTIASIERSLFYVWSENEVKEDAKFRPVVSGLFTFNPNPFNGAGSFRFSLAQNSFVRIAIQDISGKYIESSDLGMLSTGAYNIPFDLRNASSGTYIATLETPIEKYRCFMVLIK